MSSSASQRPKAAPLGVEVTDDAFLGGRVQRLATGTRIQSGPRFGDVGGGRCRHAAPARLRFGCGRRGSHRCASPRASRGLHITGVEIDRDLAELAQANAARNAHAASFEIVVADVLKRPRALERQSFHHVITNPPFHNVDRGTRAPAPAKAQATSARPARPDRMAALRARARKARRVG